MRVLNYLIFVCLIVGLLGCSDDLGSANGDESGTDSTTDGNGRSTDSTDDTTDSGDGSTDSESGGNSSDSDTSAGGSDNQNIYDLDSDGYMPPFDCDDQNADISPAAIEIGDNDIDDDCDGDVDEEEVQTDILYDWDMYLTCDNQIDIYFGTPLVTEGALVGQHTNWQTEGHFTATGRGYSDYMYVVTSSDHSTAQGFIGIFTNTTLNKTTTTADEVWEVFAAGAHPETNPFCTTAPCTGGQAWPVSQLPTQEQVDTAITYAHTNNLFVTPYSHPDYDLDETTSMTVFDTYWWNRSSTTHPNLPAQARWIWHDSTRNPDTANAPGAYLAFNHDEFLVFRVKGIVPDIN